jgi:hypothetical protein
MRPRLLALTTTLHPSMAALSVDVKPLACVSHHQAAPPAPAAISAPASTHGSLFLPAIRRDLVPPLSHRGSRASNAVKRGISLPAIP